MTLVNTMASIGAGEDFMNQHSMQEASIPNPALEPFSVLIGDWNIIGTHRHIPDTILHGRSSFEWLANGAFVIMRSELDEPGVPSSISIFGSDDLAKEYFMLYFDERGVSRKYDVTLHDNILKMWRNAPGFSQRFTGTIEKGGNTMIGIWDLSEDGSPWAHDLELTYKRVD